MGRTVWLAPAIAWRYLLSKKKHGAVGVITWISVVGVAVATAATVCVLSVFNGFQQVLGDKLDTLSPDVELTSANGRSFTASDTLLHAIEGLPQVADVCAVVQDRALAVYAGQEMPVRVMGMETQKFRDYSGLDSVMLYGTDSFLPLDAELPAENTGDEEFSEEAILAEEMGPQSVDRIVVSAGVGMRLGIPGIDSGRLTLISPRRRGQVNISNPAASLNMTEVDVEGVYRTMQSDLDKDYVLMPLDGARRLLEIEEPRITSLYIYAAPGVDDARLAYAVGDVVPDTLQVRDRLRQHESQFRMSNIEKWITFLLLAFILLIASFNLISSLAMLVIDKQENLGVLHYMGASRRVIGNIFAWESGMVTLVGGLIGIILGVTLSLLQQHFGLIRLNGDPGTLVLESYPARFIWSDLMAVAIPLAVIGFVTAMLTADFARSRVN